MEYSNIGDYIRKTNSENENGMKIVANLPYHTNDLKKKDDDNINYKIDKIFEILSRLEDKVNSIEKKIGSDNLLVSNAVNLSNIGINGNSNMGVNHSLELVMKEIKPQVFDDIDDKTLKAHLRKRRVESDGSLLYKIYFEGLPRNLFPIRIVRKSSIEYWLNDRWNEDMDGEYIKETLSKNLIASYTKINKFSSTLTGSVESDFMKNQNYILSLRDKKYQSSLWEYLRKNYLY